MKRPLAIFGGDVCGREKARDERPLSRFVCSAFLVCDHENKIIARCHFVDLLPLQANSSVKRERESHYLSACGDCGILKRTETVGIFSTTIIRLEHLFL